MEVQARLPEPVEVAAYYVVSEALANAAKHAHASVAHVEVAGRATAASSLSVRDDGVGGATPGRGSGLVGLTDRVQALGWDDRRSTAPPGRAPGSRSTCRSRAALPASRHRKMPARQEP